MTSDTDMAVDSGTRSGRGFRSRNLYLGHDYKWFMSHSCRNRKWVPLWKTLSQIGFGLQIAVNEAVIKPGVYHLHFGSKFTFNLSEDGPAVIRGKWLCKTLQAKTSSRTLRILTIDAHCIPSFSFNWIFIVWNISKYRALSPCLW